MRLRGGLGTRHYGFTLIPLSICHKLGIRGRWWNVEHIWTFIRRKSMSMIHISLLSNNISLISSLLLSGLFPLHTPFPMGIVSLPVDFL